MLCRSLHIQGDVRTKTMVLQRTHAKAGAALIIAQKGKDMEHCELKTGGCMCQVNIGKFSLHYVL